jgi:hypothetical protein
MAEYSTHLFSLLFSTILLLLFFSTILVPPPPFVVFHSFALLFPLLFSIVSQSHSLHSCCYEFQNLKMFTTSNNKHKLLSIVTPFFHPWTPHPSHSFFLPSYHLLINVWSLKLIRPIIISLRVPCTTTWKHLASSLWMNITNFIFWLLHIHILPTLTVQLHFVCHVHLLMTTPIYMLTMSTHLLIVPIFLLIVRIHLMIRQIFLLIQSIPMTNHIQISTSQILHFCSYDSKTC